MTTQKERYEVLSRLERAGISYEDANKLRRIALTLHRWSELECGTDTGAIERDEVTGKPYWYRQDRLTTSRYAVPDREKGALARLKALMAKYPGFTPYVQGDPRGASLYLVPASEVKRHKGMDIDCFYSQGIAVY